MPGAKARPETLGAVLFLFLLRGVVPAQAAGDDSNARVSKLLRCHQEHEKSLHQEEKKVGTLTVTLSVSSDAYRHLMLEGFMKLLGEGAQGQILWSKMRALHESVKPHKDKVLVHLLLNGDANYFIQNDLKSAVALRSKSLKSQVVGGVNPPLSFQPWSVLESASQQKKLSLATFKTLNVDVLATLKDRKEPLKLSLKGIASQTQKADRNNSVNVQSRQISCKSWAGLYLPEAAFTIEQEKLKPSDPPAGFEELMQEIAGDGDSKDAKKKA